MHQRIFYELKIQQEMVYDNQFRPHEETSRSRNIYVKQVYVLGISDLKFK